MKKNTFWFYHDYHARTDIKLLTLIRKKGWESYGLYWAVVEKLHEAGGWLNDDPESLAYELRADINCITAVIRDFGLFIFKNKRFSSNRVLANLLKKEKASEIARNNVNKRWDKVDGDIEGKGYGRITTVEQPNSDSNTTEILGEKRREEEKRKEKKKTKDSRTPFGAADLGSLPTNAKKTPKTAKAGEEPTPHWHETLDHMNRAWTARRKEATGETVPFSIPPQFLPALRAHMRIFPAPQTMALWDVFLESKQAYAKRMGYSLDAFLRMVNQLTDDPGYKMRVRQYDEQLNGRDDEGVLPVLQVLRS